jgi:hypothetical protein
MKEQLQQTIEQLRQHVLKNIGLIKANENHIREVLTWPVSSERTKELDESYKFSKSLLSENNDFINLQVSVMNFINKYKNVFQEQQKEQQQAVKVIAQSEQKESFKISREDCFKLTVENAIAFNNDHPYFNDQTFYNDLFSYFEHIENYEMCAELLLMKR